jgi:hypothetical protein
MTILEDKTFRNNNDQKQLEEIKEDNIQAAKKQKSKYNDTHKDAESK